jgi:hypothetical protein
VYKSLKNVRPTDWAITFFLFAFQKIGIDFMKNNRATSFFISSSSPSGLLQYEPTADSLYLVTTSSTTQFSTSIARQVLLLTCEIWKTEREKRHPLLSLKKKKNNSV